ncbi:hypothetical protein Lal_00003277 [Lupinus albus]|uniref:Uncharacterized protein n=1 Tax=Lupinus albus TaxID=3870 RepID=A0A6A4N934_LUPAL|nr:hypothetical protein Lalb_Chr22g0356961 [Lupinus albus]KAF1883095.1 hypothetical protein Lal_00003277 [Lupinus albus]
MAREFLANFHGDGAGRDNSWALFLFGVIFFSLSVVSIIIFSCGEDPHSHRRKRRGISGIGGDGGGGDGGGGHGGGDGGGGHGGGG